MGRPSPQLIELAAGRALADGARLARAEVAAAFDHRMQGLVLSAVRSGELVVTPASGELLVADDLVRRRRLEVHQRALATIAAAGHVASVEIAVFKGVAIADRYYRHSNERPSVDIDVWIAPRHRHRLRDLLAVLDPRHPLLLADLEGLVRHQHLSSVQVDVDHAPVDLHVDILKLGVPSGLDDRLWARNVELDLIGVGSVAAPDAASSLLQLLLHLNKDRFRWLLGLADIVRVVGRDPAAVDGALDLAAAGGLATPTVESLRTVYAELGLVGAPAAAGGWRGVAWRRLWPASVRLLGADGRDRARNRQAAIPLLRSGPGSARAAAASLGRALLPPSPLVDQAEPGLRGPYARRLVTARLRRRTARRARARAAQMS